jgi:hypothetical protein
VTVAGRPSRHPDVLLTEAFDGYVALDRRTNDLVQLRIDAGLLLSQLDGSLTVEELLAESAQGDDVATVRLWLLDTLHALEQASLIEYCLP